MAKKGKGYRQRKGKYTGPPPRAYVVDVEHWTGGEFTRTRCRVHAFSFDGAIAEARKKYRGCTVMGVETPEIEPAAT